MSTVEIKHTSNEHTQAPSVIEVGEAGVVSAIKAFSDKSGIKVASISAVTEVEPKFAFKDSLTSNQAALSKAFATVFYILTPAQRTRLRMMEP